MRHLLSTADLSRADALAVLDTAEEMAAVNQREVKKLPALRGRTVVNLFLEDSTRTRISFEAAAKRLSADVINFSAKGSSVSKGESLKDTVQTLAAIGADAIVKGLRGGADLEFEAPMAAMNRHLTGVETVYLPADARYTHVSSSLIKEVHGLGGDVAEFVPAAVLRGLDGGA